MNIILEVVKHMLLWFVFKQSLGITSCFICGIGAIQVYNNVHGVPTCVFLDLLWNHMDTNRWDIVSAAILLADTHTGAFSSQIVSA